ncbi:MAG: radical SAM protein [Candidatus Latescibacterota bacterium]
MRVLLINPNRVHGMKVFDLGSDQDFEIDGDDYGQFPPLGLLYLASSVQRARPQDEVALIDAIAERVSAAELEQRIRDFGPDVVGISTFTMVLYDCCLIAELARLVNPRVHVCFGGPHITDFAAETASLPMVDSVVLGEGEETFVELLHQLEQGRPVEEVPGVFTRHNVHRVTRAKSRRPMIRDLDALPHPDRSLLKQHLYYNAIGFEPSIATVITSRGCPKQCTFCATMHSHYRVRSLPNVLEEIGAILDGGIREIFFQDDTFNLLGERAREFCRHVLAAGLRFSWSFKARVDQIDEELMSLARRAGCRQIHIGVETGTQEGLDYLKKGVTLGQLRRAFALAHEHGIRTIADWMIGLPFERSEADIDRNFEFLLALDPYYVQINVLQPFPFTRIFAEAESRRLDNLERWRAWCSCPTPHFQKGVWTEYLTAAQLNAKARQLYRRFYFRPEYIARSVVSLANHRDLWRKVQGARRLLVNSGRRDVERNRQRYANPTLERLEHRLRASPAVTGEGQEPPRAQEEVRPA